MHETEGVTQSRLKQKEQELEDVSEELNRERQARLRQERELRSAIRRTRLYQAAMGIPAPTAGSAESGSSDANSRVDASVSDENDHTSDASELESNEGAAVTRYRN